MKRELYAKHTITTVGCSGGHTVIWGFFAALGPGQPAIIEGVYPGILQDNGSVIMCKLKLIRS